MGSDTELFRMDEKRAEEFAARLNYRHRDGTIVAVVQHYQNGAVLMVAFMNREAVVKTLTTGYVHFWSLSRKKLWMKGETSGNRLRLKQVLVDCDLDTLLLRVEPEGPVCHTGHETCFYRRLERDGMLRDYEWGERRTPTVD